MKVTLSILLFSLVYIPAHAQPKLVGYKSNQEYEIYRGSIKSSLKRLGESENRTVTIKGIPNEKADTSSAFEIYPHLVLNISFKDSLDQHPVIKCYDAVSLTIIQRSKKKVYTYNRLDSTISGPHVPFWASYYLNMTESSSEVRFIYTLFNDRYRENGTMICLDKKTVRFNDGKEVFPNVQDYLRSKCGSLTNFIDAKNYDDLESSIREEAFRSFDSSKPEQLNAFVKNNWKFYLKSFPTDTVNTMKMLLKDISIYSGASSKQMKEIELKIRNNFSIKKPAIQQPLPPSPNDKILEAKLDLIMHGNKSFGLIPIPPYERAHVIFMNVDVHKVLPTVLSASQLERYLRHCLVTDIQFHKADDRIYYYILKDSNGYSTIEAKNQAYKNYIRDIFISK